VNSFAGIGRIGPEQLHCDTGSGLWNSNPLCHAFFYDVLLNSGQGESIEYLRYLYQSDTMLLAKGLLTTVITLPLQEVRFGIEEVLKFLVVLPPLVFKGESKVFTVSI